MCVIMAVKDVRPTIEMIDRAWDANDHGAGIAWRETVKKDGKSTRVVRWQKGLMKLEEIKELCLKVPMPYVVHFRIASVGGIRPSLTHPFPISLDVPLDLSGTTKDAVLFHNGTWSPWSDKIIDSAIASNNKLPVGEWSDSRALAWMSHVYGPGFMEVLTTQRGVYFSPTKTEVFVGPGWVRVNDIWCSNDSPAHKVTRYKSTYHGRICSAPKCRNQVYNGDDTCFSCREEIRKAKEKLTGGTPVNPQQGSSTHTTETKAQTALVKVNGTQDPLAEALTLQEAMDLFKVEGMTKTDLKKYRKLTTQFKRAVSDKRRSKLVRRILEHSQKVCRATEQITVHG